MRSTDSSASTSSGGIPDEVVVAAAKGDADAMRQLLITIRPVIVRYCRARLGRRESAFGSADDIAQEVCFAVVRALPSYRHEGVAFMAFVYGIAAHKVADFHRKASRDLSDPVGELPDSVELDAGPEQHAIEEERRALLAKLLDTLGPTQREILVLRLIVGLSAEETADAIGSTPGAVRVAQHRALARLRKSLPTLAPALV
ncbi:RNA polymerase sigma factor ShbA [Herbihabitans rhizosphaerae]|uniref:RNA polymerase sigma factor ShbA n=1 Tax=Herbihabitans rhizosphaerae TaxID=1872711 RepID=UPI003BF819D3